MSKFHKSLIGMLNIALILVFPFVMVGLSLAVAGGVICMLTGIPFHTIMTHPFVGIIFTVLWIVVMIYMGEHLIKND